MQGLRHYLLAVQFFTRIPVTGRLAAWVGYSPAMLRASAAHFPGVGLLVGLLVASVSALLWWGLAPNAFRPLVVAVLGTVAGVLITGAFHEDGLADVADGLGGSADRARALEIMKDSRIGAFGAVALVLVLLSKVALLASIGVAGWGALVLALVLGHTVSRTWPLLIIRWLPHVGDSAQSKSKPLADQISTAALWVGFIWCFSPFPLVLYGLFAIKMVVSPWGLLAAVLWSAMAAAAVGRWLRQRLGGFTGDGLGAAQQVGEIAFYLGWALWA